MRFGDPSRDRQTLNAVQQGGTSQFSGKDTTSFFPANCKNFRDLAPLIGSPIRELNLEGCTDLTDLEPLAKMEQLEAVIIPAQCKDIEFLRSHLSLRRLSYKKLTQPVYEFWQEFDAKKDAPAVR